MNARAAAAGTLLLLAANVMGAQRLPIEPWDGAVDTFIRQRMADRSIPGVAVAIVRQGRVRKLSAYGTASLEFGTPVTVDTVFNVASVTKAFTGLAVMRLVEDGTIGLDDPVGRYLSDLPVSWRPVTIRQLMAHTSGLPVIDVDQYSSHTKAQTLPDALRLLAALPVEAPPGTRWSYNSTNYMLLGMLVEKVSGGPYTEFMRARFFEPLGLTSAVFGDSRTVVRGRATVYTRLQFDTPTPRPVDRAEVLDYSMPVFVYPGGGLNISARDFATWMAAVAQSGLITERGLETVRAPVRLNDGTVFSGRPPAFTGYGLGWTLGLSAGRSFAGGTGGLRAAFAMYHSSDLAVAVLTNFQGAGPEALVNGIVDLVLGSASHRGPSR